MTPNAIISGMRPNRSDRWPETIGITELINPATSVPINACEADRCRLAMANVGMYWFMKLPAAPAATTPAPRSTRHLSCAVTSRSALLVYPHAQQERNAPAPFEHLRGRQRGVDRIGHQRGDE